MTIRNRSTSSFATRASYGESPAVLTLVKALDVMEAVAGSSGMTVAEIAAKVGLNRTTAHRLVQTLKNLHYLQPAASGRGFEIGLKLLPLAAQQLDSNKVRLAALPHLNTLAQQAGERVNLGVLFGSELLYLAGVEKPSLPNMAIVAYYPQAEMLHLVGREPLRRQTENTIVEVDALMRDLADTRRRGYAFDNEEHLVNVWCIAAPVFDGGPRPAAAVGISGNDRERVLSMADKVKLTAEVITHVLSPTRPLGGIA